MNVLDDVENRGELIYKPILPFVLKYGGIGAVVLSVANIVQVKYEEAIEQNELTTIYIGLGVIACYIILMVLVARNYKRNNEGFMSLKKAFSVTFLTGLIICIGNFISSFILVYLCEDAQSFKHVFESFGISDLDPNYLLVYAVALFMALIIGCLLGAIVALLIGLATRKERPKGFNVL